jgi:hypothetical protein
VETVKKPSSNRRAKDRRNTLFRVLDAVSTYGSLLKDEELELRVIALEEMLKNSILIPKPQDDSTKRKKLRQARSGF